MGPDGANFKRCGCSVPSIWKGASWLTATLCATLIGGRLTAAEPGWSPVIVARGDYRAALQSLPIEQRPYRPLHFYGNTVRRMHYRGTPLPLVRSGPIPAGFDRGLTSRIVGNGRFGPSGIGSGR